MPSAAIVPKVVARIALISPIVALFQRADWMFESWSARWYHLRLNPCQSVMARFVPLKLNTTTTTIGRKRKT